MNIGNPRGEKQGARFTVGIIVGAVIAGGGGIVMMSLPLFW